MSSYYRTTEERRPPDELLWNMFQCRILHKVLDSFFITAELNEELNRTYGDTFAVSTIIGATDIDYEISKGSTKINHEESTLKCASIATTVSKVFLVVDESEVPRLRKIVEKEGYKFRVIDIETALIIIKELKEVAVNMASPDGSIVFSEK